jgi:hypothetical protein
MKKIYLLLTLALLVNTVLTAQTKTGAKFSFTKTSHDFGVVKQGPDIFHEFTFTNTGTEPLVIFDASGSCSCTIPTFDRAPVKPGGVGKVKVKFETKDKNGTFNKTVYIKSNATARNEPFEIYIKGSVLVKGKTVAKK